MKFERIFVEDIIFSIDLNISKPKHSFKACIDIQGVNNF
jgi:hypothetical protein